MRLRVALSLALALAAPGCGGAKLEPELLSSGDEASYAVAYPAMLSQTATGVAGREAEAKKIREGWSKMKSELSGLPADKLADLVRRADRAGKSRAYAERRREIEGTNEFFLDAKDVLTKKPAGVAQYLAKGKCDVELGGPVAKAVEDSFGKSVEKRLRDQNDAFVLVEQLRDPAGKEKAALLEQRADEIAFASYVVHVDLVDRKVRLRRMLDEVDAVKRSLSRASDAEKDLQGEPKRTPADKKASEERLQKIRAATAALDAAVSQGREAEKELEKRIEAAQKEHDQAIAELLRSLGA